jgi:uncharacterized protein (TIGR00255 family)
MIYSMTGYAATAREYAWGTLSIELRSVNHRYLDIQFRVPDELRTMEPQLRETLAARMTRGKLDCRIALAAAAGPQRLPELNAALLQQLVALDGQVRLALPGAASMRVADILRWPGMLGAEEQPLDVVKAACRELALTALEEFLAARGREGEKLKMLLLERAAAMEARLADVLPRMPQVLAAFREKLAARLKEAMVNGDDERIRQEITLFANRIDVDEELSRLAAHIAELRSILGAGGAVGKRLDFLMQELNREANTLGSKSVDLAVTRAAMDLKLLIEQMREQIQNIE